jgi:hypothetical protein
MRIWIYTLAGITSVLIGWNIAQFFITDLGLLQQYRVIVLFPCIAVALAVGLVFTEIFISNPTRPKLNLRIAPLSLSIAAGLGLIAGLLAGVLFQVLSSPETPIDAGILRILGWLIIGCSTGIAEGITWRWRSVEAGDTQRFKKRLNNSIFAGIAASLVAAVVFETLRNLIGAFPPELIGFSILGILLGFFFSLSTSPSYMVALRTGAGFEYIKEYISDSNEESNKLQKPIIDTTNLKFVSDITEEIEEGLSIQLPATGSIKIGSADDAHIRIPALPTHVADLKIHARETILVPDDNYFGTIEVNGERLKSRKHISLKHNYILTFYPQNKVTKNESKFYRFVYYNRFFDPLA